MAESTAGRHGRPDDPVARRAEITAQVRAWCESAHVVDGPLAGPAAELSQDAAVLIAAGHLDLETRHVLTNRRRVGRRLPDAGGYGALRRLADDFARADGKARQMRPGAMQVLASYRAGEIERRLLTARAHFVHSPAHYANGVRAIRRDRRDGVHLEPMQREVLFDALTRTPGPVSDRRGPTDQATVAALSVTAERLAGLAQRTPWGATARKAADALAGAAAEPGDRFADRFDALLYLAGRLYDRIDGSAAWRSDHFAVQRVQLDLADELMQIAVDTVALRGIEGELAVAMRSAHDSSSREQILARRRALAPVWGQLVERVAALARIGDLLGEAERQLQSIAAVQRTMSLDSRIDDLVARAGNRELSTANTHNVGDQMGSVDELMLGYQALIHGDILALQSRLR
ncbi:hypothetical protein [Rhodococcus triatomae]|nr:hypothetical protein G419_09121 [Rhodococcus triatomae BKS 15-14]